jgi:hypothetical protein
MASHWLEPLLCTLDSNDHLYITNYISEPAHFMLEDGGSMYFETSIFFHNIIWCHNPEDSNIKPGNCSEYSASL